MDEGTVVIDPAGWEPIPFGRQSWSAYLPPPRLQLKDAAPPGWGTCSIHAYAEAFTARMRIACNDPMLEVDLRALISACIVHDILTEEGTSEVAIGRLARYYGIPVQGFTPTASTSHDGGLASTSRSAEEGSVRGLRYALGTTVASFEAVPLPPGTEVATRAMMDAALAYREALCKHIRDGGPVVVAFLLQQHYLLPRDPDEPYRLIPGLKYLTEKLSDGKIIPAAHAVVVYGYDCPGGDVRTLRLFHQDNMKDAPPRHLIHPDALMEFHVPVIDGLVFSMEPKKSQDLLHPEPPPVPAHSGGLWERIRDLILQ